MNNENTTTVTDEKEYLALTKEANRISYALDHAFSKRYELLRNASLRIDDSERYSNRADINGHRAMIGLCYKVIRISCHISIEEMAAKCDESTQRLKELENRGFMPIQNDFYCEFQYRDSLLKNIYVGYLKLILHENGIDHEEFDADAMITLNRAFISDIDNRLVDIGRISGYEVLVEVFENIQNAYDEINKILEPHLEM